MSKKGYLDFDTVNEIQTEIEESSFEIELGNLEASQDHSKLYNRGKADAHPISSITSLQDVLDSKVDKEENKCLSSNDFTDEFKTKLDSLINIYSVGNGIVLNDNNILELDDLILDCGTSTTNI